MKITVCLSVGCNPISGRPRMSAADRAALAMALAMNGDVTGVFAGPEAAALRDYLGAGLTRIERLDVPEGHDVSPALVAHLRATAPDLVLCGARAETGMSSGLLPYQLAEELGWPVLARVMSVRSQDGLRVLQAAPGGRRRLRLGWVPAVLIADPRAAGTRLSHPGAQAQGRIERFPAAATVAEPHHDLRPARKRGQRLRAASGAAPKARAPLHDALSPAEAARLILASLRDEGLLPAAHTTASEGPTDV